MLPFENWCGREDLNLQGVASTTTSTLRVYQFRHDRLIFNYNQFFCYIQIFTIIYIKEWIIFFYTIIYVGFLNSLVNKSIFLTLFLMEFLVFNYWGFPHCYSRMMSISWHATTILDLERSISFSNLDIKS